MTEENKSVKNFPTGGYLMIPKLRFPGFDVDWKTTTLGKIGQIINGLTYSPNDIDEKGVLVLRSSNVQNRIITFTDNVFVKAENFNPVKENDILICVRNGSKNLIGKNALVKKENEGLAFGAFMAIYRSEFNKFLFQWFDTKDYKDIVNKNLGATINSINSGDLKKFTVPFPCLDEQQKISSFLTLIDSRIQTQKKIIREVNVLKTTVTKRIFSEQLKFKDDGGNDFPKWERKTLGESGEFLGGGTPTSSNSDFWNGNIPWVSSSDLFENDIHSINITRFITENAINNSATKLCKAPLILIVSRVGVGKVAYSEKALCTSQDFLNMNNFNCNGIFLTYLLSMEMKKTASSTQGTSIKGISSSDIKSKQILLPCITEQNKIANFFKSIDEKINLESDLLSQYENQKKYLLKKLFV